jgi:hypothetical protein
MRLTEEANVDIVGHQSEHRFAVSGTECSVEGFHDAPGVTIVPVHNSEPREAESAVDGDSAAVIWTETARTRTGTPWHNHGVDVFHVHDGVITLLHENNDVRLVHEFLPPYTVS